MPFQRCFEIASLQHDVPLPVLLGVASVESGFDPDARSHAGAHGIMQIRWPVTARHLGVRRISELYNPCINIDLGAAYLAELLARYDQDLTLALAAYNYGPTRLRQTSDIPPGVQGYVNRVMQQTPPEPPEVTGIVVLNKFHRHSLAERFTKVISQWVPGSALIISEPREGLVVVSLDRGQVSPVSLAMLQRVYPLTNQ